MDSNIDLLNLQCKEWLGFWADQLVGLESEGLGAKPQENF